ncbi:unnamed protein product [Prorocentrum cordatum]|uniref:Uncharacterized protein n=1 Tax=Prorocentrum cordatum TaxID=2364126 RepID=A0ABN9PT68_9DINO|nr:unnamed protein product [Polarella glacialis]
MSSPDDWQAGVFAEAQRRTDAKSTGMLARWCYTNWEGECVVAHGFETTWDWLKLNCTAKGERTSGGVEEQIEDAQDGVRYFKTVGRGPELFAVAGKTMYYHMSKGCMARLLQIKSSPGKSEDCWYRYPSFHILDLGVVAPAGAPQVARDTLQWPLDSRGGGPRWENHPCGWKSIGCS